MRQCPIDRTSCANLDCLHGCAGIDIHVEAVTVIHTTLRRRAAVSLVYGPDRGRDDVRDAEALVTPLLAEG